MAYRTKKGLEGPHPEKTKRQKFLTLENLNRMLEAVEQEGTATWQRDHAVLYFSFYLALRVGECALLERKNFRHLSDATIYIPTLKQSERVQWVCPECGRKARVSSNKIGHRHYCAKIGCRGKGIVATDQEFTREPPELAPPSIENHVLEYAAAYLERMRPDQRWLFEGRKEGQQISRRMLRYIFGHYAMAAGLDKEFSFHSLRHGRGSMVWELFGDPQMVKEMLRHKGLGAHEVYIHLSESLMKQRQKALEAYGEQKGK